MVNPRFFSRHAETRDRKELKELQLKRLRHTIKTVFESVAFYRQNLKEHGIDANGITDLEDIKNVPFTTKEDLRRNYPFGLAAVPRNHILELHASSGTTGVPTLGLYTASDLEVWAELMARCLAMSGLTKDDVFQITPSFGMFTGAFGFYYGARKIGATIVPTGAGFSKRQIQYMRDFGTTMICAVVSYSLRLAEVAREMGFDPARDTNVRKGVFGSETWTQQMKRKIADLWNMDAYDIYGLTELFGPGVANDCYLHDGMHVWEDHFLVEVVDSNTGEVLEPEEEGELVFTTLTKDGMPLLRYRTRDLSFLYDSKSCDCGRTHRKISWISGRTDDMVKASGVSIWPSQVEAILMQHREVGPEYQIVLSRINHVDRVKVVAESVEKLAEADRKNLATRLLEDLASTLLFRPQVEVVDPLTLPRVEAGKAKRVIDTRGKTVTAS